MKERHFAYRVIGGNVDLVCSHSEFNEDKMLDLLKEIKSSYCDGIFWIYTQKDDLKRVPFSIIDCEHQRIYYHFSGDVEDLDETIAKLSKTA